MTTTEFPFASPAYHLAWQLREEVLRRPLGLSLRDEDLSPEAAHLHFGIFGPDGTLLACLIATPLAPGTFRLRQMAVHPQHQHQGLGRQLIQDVERALAARGCTKLTLHARMTAVGFYSKLGYAVIGQQFTEVGLPHLKMEKLLR
jgi:ribosomal protein S18 acetylase RimI-like enzyme